MVVIEKVAYSRCDGRIGIFGRGGYSSTCFLNGEEGRNGVVKVKSIVLKESRSYRLSSIGNAAKL